MFLYLSHYDLFPNLILWQCRSVEAVCVILTVKRTIETSRTCLNNNEGWNAVSFTVFSFLDQADKCHSLLSCRSLYLHSTSSAVICYFFPVSVAGIYHRVVCHCETMLFQFTASLVSPLEPVALQVFDCVCMHTLTIYVHV